MNARVAEGISYAVAFVILVVGGMVLRTTILNWFVGPTIVVLTVVLLTPVLSRGRGRPT